MYKVILSDGTKIKALKLLFQGFVKNLKYFPIFYYFIELLRLWRAFLIS